MKSKLLIFIIIGLFLISLTTAIDEQGIGTEGKSFEFIQTCNDAIYITLSTLQFPNRSVVSINTNITTIDRGAFKFNYTNLVNGRYDLTVISDGCSKTFATFFEVTPSGKTNNLGFYILIYAIVFGITIFGFAIRNEWIAILGGMGLIFLGVYTMNTGIVIFRDDATKIISYVVIGLGAIVSIVTSLQIIEDQL